jgi:hypothetical protein
MAEEDRMDVLGLYKWKAWQRARAVLGEGMEDNYIRNVL